LEAASSSDRIGTPATNNDAKEESTVIKGRDRSLSAEENRLRADFSGGMSAFKEYYRQKLEISGSPAEFREFYEFPYADSPSTFQDKDADTPSKKKAPIPVDPPPLRLELSPPLKADIEEVKVQTAALPLMALPPYATSTSAFPNSSGKEGVEIELGQSDAESRELLPQLEADLACLEMEVKVEGPFSKVLSPSPNPDRVPDRNPNPDLSPDTDLNSLLNPHL